MTTITIPLTWRVALPRRRRAAALPPNSLLLTGFGGFLPRRG